MGFIDGSDNVFPKIIGSEQGSDPSTPSASQRKLYPKADGWYDIDDAGIVTGPFAPASGGSELTRVHRATNQTINNTTVTAISWSNEQWDDDGMWVIGSPTRLTCQTPGIFLVSCSVVWASSSAAGLQRQLRLHLNGAEYSSMIVPPAIPAGMTHTDIIKLTATDYIEWHVYQDRGGTLDLDSNSGKTLYASVLRVG